jgi:hypothetical protein
VIYSPTVSAGSSISFSLHEINGNVVRRAETARLYSLSRTVERADVRSDNGIEAGGAGGCGKRQHEVISDLLDLGQTGDIDPATET